MRSRGFQSLRRALYTKSRRKRAGFDLRAPCPSPSGILRSARSNGSAACSAAWRSASRPVKRERCGTRRASELERRVPNVAPDSVRELKALRGAPFF